MLRRVLKVPGVSAIELNLACPNIPGKPVIAYDFDQMDDVLRQVCALPEIASGAKPLGVKLAPYFDRPHVEKAVDIIIKHRVRFVVSINTIGNALFVDADSECASISPKGGFGGLGGGYVKHTALANVRMLSTILADRGRSADVDVVGVGGVSTGTDAFELILCGARAVQVGTCHWNEGAACFGRIAAELEDIMKRKGYSSIEDFRGKLKPYEKHASKVPVKGKAGTGGRVESSSSSSSSSSSAATINLLVALVVLLLAVSAALAGEKLGLVKLPL
jgi:dihydroorotate dehydrogenase (fumarate)